MKKILGLLFAALVLCVGISAYEFDGYIVKIKENPLSQMSASTMCTNAYLFSEMDDEQAVDLVSESIPNTEKIASRHLLIKANDEETLQTLIDLGIVESYEEDILMDLFGYDVTANPEYLQQKWYLDYINADFAWNAGIYGDGVKVGIIDSGIYPNKDIKPNLHPGANFVIPDGQTTVLNPSDTVDTVSHGTSVAGIIAAACNNLLTVGVSHNALVVPLKTTTPEGKVSTSAAVRAIYDATDYYGCSVINMSFGTTAKSESLESAVNHAINNGLIVVAATGNFGNISPGEGIEVNPIIYPAYFDNVIGVANAEISGNSLRIKSSSGYNDRVDIAAPGTSIYALSNGDTSTSTVSGTSFSTPMVSAAAALVKSVKPSIGQLEFIDLLKRSADASYIASSRQSTEKWGAGLLDIEALIKLVYENEDYIISDIHTLNDNSYICVTNLTSSYKNDCMVVVTEYDDDGNAVKTEKMTLGIGASASMEVSLTNLGFSENAVVRKYLPGDVNGDGDVNIRDASAIVRYCGNYSVNVVEAALDVNGDGSVNIRDASSILRYCAGYDVELN